jgi:uncharacterized protein
MREFRCDGREQERRNRTRAPARRRGALRLFSLHFVKTGAFEPSAGHSFSKLMKMREEADYDAAYTFTGKDFEQLKKESDSLAKQIEKFLENRER